MVTQLSFGDVTVDVVLKDIKNVHLSVHPPTGRVRISAPQRLSLENIRIFAISKLGWIKQQQRKLHKQERESPREYLERESHYVWGKRYLLKLLEINAPPSVELNHHQLVLNIRPGANSSRKQEVLDGWYRELIKQAAPPIISKWQRLMDVSVEKVFVQRMKTKWGGCNPRSGSIRLNTHLAKKPPECLEYIVVHEMVHLLERHHNDRFIAYMDRFMPQWRHRRDELNSFPLCHETWSY